MIEYHLHDINNQLNLALHQLMKLKRQHPSIEISPIFGNINEMAELVSISYDEIQHKLINNIETLRINNFIQYFKDQVINSNLKYNLNTAFKISVKKSYQKNFISIDKRLFRQILENIFQNAKHAKAKLVTIKIKLINSKVTIEIANDFKSSSNSFKKVIPSIPSGMGLKIIENNMQKMNGSFEYNQNTEKGYFSTILSFIIN